MHSETWWWNDEVAKAIEEKRYGIKPKQQVIGISIKRQDEMQEELLLHRKRQGKSLLMSWSTAGKKNVYRDAKQMAKSSQDVVVVNCMKDAKWKSLGLSQDVQSRNKWRRRIKGATG